MEEELLKIKTVLIRLEADHLSAYLIFNKECRRESFLHSLSVLLLGEKTPKIITTQNTGTREDLF